MVASSIEKLKIEISLLEELIDCCVVTHVDKENLCNVLNLKNLELERLKEMYDTGEYLTTGD